MLTATLKLIDIAARALFGLTVLYSLPVRSSGQFGLAITLIGVFAFLCSFERHADLQRRLAMQPPADADRLVFSLLRFIAVNGLLWAPVLAALLLGWVALTPAATALCLVIAGAEVLSNEVYRVAMVVPRYRPLLVIVLVKNVAVLAAVLMLISTGEPLHIEPVLSWWAALSAFGVAACAWRHVATATLRMAARASIGLSAQYRASRTHFVIGIVALAAVQADRLVAGGLLAFEQSGLYFRHAFLATFAHQVANVVSYNRVAPVVYAMVNRGQVPLARAIVRRELCVLVPAGLALVAFVSLIDFARFGDLPGVASLQPTYLAALALAALLRASADCNALLLNAAHRERDIFVSQLVAVTIAVAANVALTLWFGIAGTIAAVLVGALLYLAQSLRYARAIGRPDADAS